MRKAGLLLALLLFTLLFYPPLVDAQQLENVYVLDAVQGRYYAINTNGQSYRVFYLSGGSTVYVSAYRWDLNQSYIIFQSPITGRLYLRSEPYVLSVLSTSSWFTPQLPYATFSVTLPSPWSATIPVTLYAQTSNEQWYYNGTHVVYSTSLSQRSTSVSLGVSTALTANTWYNASIGIVSSYLMSSYDAYPVPITYTTYEDPYKWVCTGNALYYVSTYPATNQQSSCTVACIPVSQAGTVSGSFSNRYRVDLTVRWSVSSLTCTWPKTNNIITASNGNVIQVYDSISSLSYVSLISSSSTASYYIYAQTVQVNFGMQVTIDKPLVLKLDTSQLTIVKPNIAVYIPSLSAWCPSYVINFGTQDTFVIIPLPQITVSSLTLKIAWTYPIPYEKPSLVYNYVVGSNLVSLFPITGEFQVVDGVAQVNGTMYLTNYIGSTIIIDVEGEYSYNDVDVGYANDVKMFYVKNPSATISGNVSYTRCLILYNTMTLMNYSYTVGAPSYEAFQISQLSYMPSGQIQGSWNYRLPIYIQLAELPPTLTESGYVFRVVLPLKSWVNAQLLSPALEDLLITDANMKPLPFFVADFDGGVVYIRYTNPIYSSTIVIYVLLRNTQLWNSGNSFSSLTATFDKVNSYDFTDDFGYSTYYTYLTYNLLVVKPRQDTTVKFGKTWFDFVAVNNTMIIEQHGSTIFYNNTLSLGVNERTKEVMFIVDRQRMKNVLVYVDGQAKITFDLAEYQSDPCLYIGYKNAQAAYVGRMLFYSYSIGDIQGGVISQPAKITKTSQAQQQPQTVTIDLWSMTPLLFVIIVLGIAFRLMNTGGGRREDLLSRI